MLVDTEALTGFNWPCSKRGQERTRNGHLVSRSGHPVTFHKGTV